MTINSGAEYTTSTSVTLAISCGDTDTTGYQMKKWGIDGVSTESDIRKAHKPYITNPLGGE